MIFLIGLALIIWSIAFVVLFGVNIDYKNKFLHILIRTEKK